MRRGIGAVRGSSEIVLHPEVAGPGLLDDGVTEGSGKEDQRPFAFRGDAVDVFLKHDTGAAVEFVEELLRGGGIVFCDELRAVSGRGDSRLHHCFVPAQVAEFLLQGDRICVMLRPEGGNNRNAFGVEVAEVGFVRVPAEERGGVEDRNVRGVELLDPGKKSFGLEVVVPTGADQDGGAG
jgi:hypothetical protein